MFSALSLTHVSQRDSAFQTCIYFSYYYKGFRESALKRGSTMSHSHQRNITRQLWTQQHHGTAMNTSWDGHSNIMRQLWTQQHHGTAMNTSWDGHSNIMGQLWTQQHHKKATDTATSLDGYEHRNITRQLWTHHGTAMDTAMSWGSYEHSNVMGQLWTQQCHSTAMNIAASQDSYEHIIMGQLWTQQCHGTAMNTATSWDGYEHSNITRQLWTQQFHGTDTNTAMSWDRNWCNFWHECILSVLSQTHLQLGMFIELVEEVHHNLGRKWWCTHDHMLGSHRSALRIIPSCLFPLCPCGTNLLQLKGGEKEHQHCVNYMHTHMHTHAYTHTHTHTNTHAHTHAHTHTHMHTHTHTQADICIIIII